MLILIVDDDASIRETFRMVIESEAPGEFDIITAGSTAEAGMLIDDMEPDVLILDYPLFEWACAPLVKAAKKGAKLIVVTATQASEEVIRRNTGVQTILRKPFDMEDLLFHIRN